MLTLVFRSHHPPATAYAIRNEKHGVEVSEKRAGAKRILKS